jgi:hypothetical protein
MALVTAAASKYVIALGAAKTPDRQGVKQF